MKLRVNMRVLKGMAIGLSVLILLMTAALLLRNLDENQGQDTAPDVSSNAEGSSSCLGYATKNNEKRKKKYEHNITYYGSWYR